VFTETVTFRLVAVAHRYVTPQYAIILPVAQCCRGVAYSIDSWHFHVIVLCAYKSEGSQYSITERTVPELISVIGSQPAGDVSHKPGGRLPVLPPGLCSYPHNP